MNADTDKQSNQQEHSRQSARTDDLLASGADAQDGARGFAGTAAPDALETGMEGIAGAADRGNKQSESRPVNTTNQTVQDNADQMRNKQGG